MGLFSKAKAVLDTPFGEGTIIAGDVTVPWKRVHGVLLDLAWPDGTDPNRSLISEIEERLEGHLVSCEIALGIPEFPAELRCVLPERIELSGDGDGDFRIVYWCPQWEDGIWGVVFRDHKVVRTYEGD